MRVLVVDDGPFQVRLLAEVLKPEHEVVMAMNGPQALEVARRARPDLVLLDVMMPEMDGLEVCRRLQADAETQHIPVIFVTGQDSTDDETTGLAVGAVDYISKPIVPAIVRARVRTHLLLKIQADQLRALAFLDGLTGAANRRRFDEQFADVWEACRRDGRSLGVVMIDVDHFKAYNDRYGHQAGDAALCAVAGRLREGVRGPWDLVARIGGEEFVVLLPDCGPEEAERAAEQIRRSVFEADILHAESSAAAVVTISAGVACVVPEPGTSRELLLALADRRLFLAKHAGRNRVVVADS
jgi:diguanylate cyclase (GGDEF)-like protein